ncbi:MAG: HAMP domain-containing protein [Proteobacteria bacterium]|nr:HAMP domain-containing protein [Pseudomonadota bacterium]
MNIRAQVTVLIAGVFVILGLAAILIGKLVIMPSFEQLERADARTAMRRIEHALDQKLEQVSIASRDWGNWTDAYRFAADGNREFITANITDVALKQIDINLLMIVDLQGKVILARDEDLKTERPLGLDLTRHDSLPPNFPWHADRLDTRAARGLIQTNLGPMVIAAAPILDGYGRGPPRGMVLMGTLLNEDAVEAIAAQAQAHLVMLPAMAQDGLASLRATDAVVQVFQPFNDVFGHPILQLRVDVPRAITASGKAAVKVAAWALLGAAVVVTLLLIVVLNRVILGPLAQVTRYAVAIGEGADAPALDLKRSDEMGVLAREFDRMVERVNETRMQLVDRSFQAGFAELAKGVLHNLGNAMTPIGVRLANLGERLRQAPAEEVEIAVGELQSPDCEPQRRADLEQFLRLAGKELAATVRGTQDDVAVMIRQTSAVQTTLAEQMRSARNEHVIEPVRLTELVSQSLEIVPDSCRQRLTVDADETLRKLGMVRVARTVLRLVLQNLIINAADAVRDAGKEKGTLRLSAEIVRDQDVPQLHLQCRDDGCGIAPQNIERVFEKGFSTKSPETNHGIGLHWCANAISALGGRIWAASEGPGLGASMHLLVPLAPRENVSAAAASAAA